MFLFPSDIDSLLRRLSERLDLDPRLMEACRPLIEKEAYQQLGSAAATVLCQRLSQKAGLGNNQLSETDWAGRIGWTAAGFAPGQAHALAELCQSVLDSFAPGRPAPLPATPKTGRAILLLTDALLDELERLPDLAPPPAEADARPFFEELVKSLNALLPYKQRDFPVEMDATQLKLLLFNLPPGAHYAVEFRPPAGDDPGRLEMGLYFPAGDLEKLTRHFRRKLPALCRSMGNKEITLQERDKRLAILLHQPYKPSGKLSAFMTAATLVGLIGSIQERMPKL